MPSSSNLPFDAGSSADRLMPASTMRESPAFECYCGLGPACPLFRLMTPPQRADCTRDKRRTAQAFYRNGLGW